jgi:hypothetical protein
LRLSLILLLSSLAAIGQTAGNLTGVVLDATGAVLSGARVEALGSETGLRREARTDANGRYVIPSLPAGTYELRVQMEKFRPVVRKDVELTIGETQAIDFRLELGGAEQAVTVTSQPPLVNVSTSELSYLVTGTALRELPLNGRNWTDLTLLQPGVTPFPHRDGGSVVAHGLAMSINGQEPRANAYLLDGTTMNSFTNGPASSAASTALGMDTIREFRVETNAYSAEFGRNFGAQINVLTKSGTNSLHGTAFHYLRNDNLDARNFFDPSERPEFRRNQFGGTIGGPLRRDRSFFFFGYEGLRESLGRTVSSEVPDLDARRGIINGINYGVNEAVRPYLLEYPLPNGPNRGAGIALYTFGFDQRLTQNFTQGRYDHIFNARHQMFARYTYDKADQYLPTDYPQFPRFFRSKNQFATAEFRQIVSPEVLNTVRLGFSRTRIGQTVEANTSQPVAPFIPGRSIMGDIDIGGLQRFGPQSSVNLSLIQNVYSAEDGLTIAWKAFAQNRGAGGAVSGEHGEPDVRARHLHLQRSAVLPAESRYPVYRTRSERRARPLLALHSDWTVFAGRLQDQFTCDAERGTALGDGDDARGHLRTRHQPSEPDRSRTDGWSSLSEPDVQELLSKDRDRVGCVRRRAHVDPFGIRAVLQHEQ